MDISLILPALERYARTLVKNHPDEDYRDLVQDTIVKLLASNADISESYTIVACKNAWRDKLAYKAVRRGIKYLEDMPVQPFGYLPQVEVDIYCKEIGINLYERKYVTSDETKALRKDRDAKRDAIIKLNPIKLAIKREQQRKRSQLWRNRNRAH